MHGTKEIAAYGENEELTLNYGKAYWKERKWVKRIIVKGK